MRGREQGRTIMREDRLNVPVIGFIFWSFARSFEASSHSFVIVRGGGGAITHITVSDGVDNTTYKIYLPIALTPKYMRPATPTRPRVDRNTLRL